MATDEARNGWKKFFDWQDAREEFMQREFFRALVGFSEQNRECLTSNASGADVRKEFIKYLRDNDFILALSDQDIDELVETMPLPASD